MRRDGPWPCQICSEIAKRSGAQSCDSKWDTQEFTLLLCFLHSSIATRVVTMISSIPSLLAWSLISSTPSSLQLTATVTPLSSCWQFRYDVWTDLEHMTALTTSLSVWKIRPARSTYQESVSRCIWGANRHSSPFLMTKCVCDCKLKVTPVQDLGVVLTREAFIVQCFLTHDLHDVGAEQGSISVSKMPWMH